jgi:hypothetical protein
MEGWRNGMLGKPEAANLKVFQHSIIPVLLFEATRVERGVETDTNKMKRRSK